MVRECVRRSECIFTAIVLLGLATPASAQQVDAPVRFGLGYVANAPEMMAGISGTVVFPSFGGIGLYVDAKFNVDSPSREVDFLEGRTALDVENTVPGVSFRDHKDSYQAFNVALVRPVNPSLMIYAGGGVATMTRYRQYKDPTEELGRAGFFWVEAPDEEATEANLLVGLLMKITPLLHMQTGFETGPKGFTVGATFLIPRID